MISKEQAVELLTDYFEQRLSPELRRAVEMHLQNSPFAAHMLKTYKKSVDLSKKVLCQRCAPVDFGPKLLGFLREQTRGTRDK
jgi:hypothetical protein